MYGWRETEQQIPSPRDLLLSVNTTMEACLGAEARAGLHSASYFGPAVSPMAR
eukprot:COSAG01_NODE_2261_length_8057_cov_38.489570_4_plen_53_part_00